MQVTSALQTPLTQAQGSRKVDDPAKIKQAAEQFEALLIGQIFKEMTSSASKGALGGEDPSSSSVLEMAQECFAQAVASRGGLGLSANIVKHFPVKEITHSTSGGDR